jgi:hypothetical protein
MDRSTAVALIALLLTLDARAADPPELPVPADALVVVQLNGVAVAPTRLESLARTVMPDRLPDLRKQFDQLRGDFLGERDLTAITPDARAYLAVHGAGPTAGGEPPIALVLPTRDLDQFRKSFLTAGERKSWFGKRNGVNRVESDGRDLFLVHLSARQCVVVTPSEPLAETYAARFKPITRAGLGERIAPIFLDPDVGVFVNLAVIREQYGPQVRQARQFIALVLQTGGAGLLPRLDPHQLEMIQDLVEASFQVLEDGTALAAGVEFRPDGLAVRAEATFAAESPIAELLKTEKPGALDRLGELPGGPVMFAAVRSGPKLARLLSGFGREFEASSDRKATAAINRHADLFAAALAGGWELATSGPTGGLSVLTPADPSALVEAHLRILRNLPVNARHQNLVVKGRPLVLEADQTHAGFVLHRVQFTHDLEATTASIADENLRQAAVETMKRLVAEKQTYWIGTDGKRVVTVTAKDWDAARRLLDDFTAGKRRVGDVEAVKSVRSLLPGEAGLVAIAETARLATGLGELARAVLDALPAVPGLDPPALRPAPDAPPTYVGLAIVPRPGSVGLTAVAPTASLATARRILLPADEKK